MTVTTLGVTPAVRALRSIRCAAQTERGLVSSRIYQEVDHPEKLCFEQDWCNEQELQSHIRSSCFTDLLMLMETASEAPVLQILSTDECSGLEYIAAVRFEGDRKLVG